MNPEIIYPGIEWHEIDYQTKEYLPSPGPAGHVIEINYCDRGRMECRMADGCLQYIGEGDLFLHPQSNQSMIAELPLGYCQGITVTIDPAAAGPDLHRLLPDLPIDLEQMAKRLFERDECLFIAAGNPITGLFDCRTRLPQEAGMVLCRLKILELIIYLYYLDVPSERYRKTYSKLQVDTIKQIHDYMTGHLSSRLTIDELARRFCISPTALKTNFKAVYGLSVMTYLRQYRIRKAAALLRESDAGIAEIAGLVGYESQSKFGAAFKELMHVSPMEYRRLP